MTFIKKNVFFFSRAYIMFLNAEKRIELVNFEQNLTH